MFNLRPAESLSHYRLVESIAEGGMGVVWSARDERLERDVAIKLLPRSMAEEPGQLERFEREARAIAALNHPNIVTIFEIDEVGGTPFLVMELIRGSPLSRLIPERGFPLGDLLDIAVPVLDAVSATHERGIAHGDLKPSNVMVDSRGRVKVLDFGLARSIGREARSEESTERSTRSIEPARRVSGTLPYMSPERMRGMPADHLCDIFALGVMLYEMSTGTRPFQGASQADLIAAILKDTPVEITDIRPGIPLELGRIVNRCLHKDRERRLQSSLDLRNELEEIRSGISTPAPGPEPSIAVLPFVDMIADKDQDYFCEGIAEEIIDALARVRGLRVASRTSSFRFKHAALGSSQIGRQLRVKSLLEGSVRKSDRRLRIVAQLTDAQSGYQLWSERYDRDMEDIFAIQEEIARSIVEALQVTLTPKESTALKATQTRDVRAYDHYLRGRKFYFQYRRRGMEFALQMFRHAIECDPSYANAHAGIADCCTFLYVNVERSEEYRKSALECSARALELAPDSAQVHASRGAALSMAGRHDEARHEFETAIRLDPDLYEAQYFYARECFAQGDRQKAIALYEKACRIRPEDYQAPLLMSQIYDDLGKKDLGRETRLRGVKLAEEHLQRHPDDLRALYMAANALVALGDRKRGLEWADRAVEMEPDDSMLLYNVGCIQAMAGEIDEALTSLEKAVRHGLAHKEWYQQDSNLDSLRVHPRFRKLLDSL